MIFLFWICSLLIFYTYIGYPILIGLRARFFAKPVRKGHYEPRISVIISAFNEEKFIEQKLLNLLSLDYPEDKIEILVGSDGASDGTDAIVARFHSPRIRFFRFIRNQGKPQVLNALAQEATGSVLLFTDVRQPVRRDAVRTLMENFYDSEVGCVSGELVFQEVEDAPIGKGMDAYWRYEKYLRKCESETGSMLGATGAIYAIRRHLFRELPGDILVDDMYIPLAIVDQGYRAIFETGAWAFDRTSSKGGEEFKRKVRTLAGNYQIFEHFLRLFNPFKSPVAWQFLSHKVMRLAVPFFLAGLLISNVFLLGVPFYRYFFLVQVLFYALAWIESRREKREPAADVKNSGKRRLGYIAYTFCLLNYSAVIGLVQYLKKSQKTSAWEKAYA